MDFSLERAKMVEGQLVRRGISDRRVLEAFRSIPRHRFVPADLAGRAYEDRPLSIGYEQTISQPYMVACMTEALSLVPGMKVLEIGTGSGYQTAVLSFLGAVVFTIERIRELALDAWCRLEELGYSFRGEIRDGTLGLPGEAPFDGILVTAGAPSLPVALAEQLVEGGKLVIPIGEESQQDLEIVSRKGGRVEREKVCPVRFVKLIGRDGW